MSKKEENRSEDSIKDKVENILDDAIEEVEKEQKADKTSPGTGNQEQTEEQEQLRADLEKEKDRFLRLFAEFENYKKRTNKERIELFKTAGQDVMQSLLPVLDDFDRAINQISKANDKNLLKGVELIHTKLQDILRSKGLEAVDVNPGDSFDADLHDAVTQVPAPNEKLKGKIVDVVEKGYKIGDKIIRYPKVVTGE